MVIVGGSPTMAGIDAAVLSGTHWQGRPLLHCFNLGLPLATTAEVCLAVEHAIGPSPRLLLYGIAVTDLNSSRLEPGGPRQLMSARDLAALRSAPGRMRYTGVCGITPRSGLPHCGRCPITARASACGPRTGSAAAGRACVPRPLPRRT